MQHLGGSGAHAAATVVVQAGITRYVHAIVTCSRIIRYDVHRLPAQPWRPEFRSTPKNCSENAAQLVTLRPGDSSSRCGAWLAPQGRAVLLVCNDVNQSSRRASCRVAFARMSGVHVQGERSTRIRRKQTRSDMSPHGLILNNQQQLTVVACSTHAQSTAKAPSGALRSCS